LAKNALLPGHSTIYGKVCGHRGTDYTYWDSYYVQLYPVTPYLQAWLKLRDEHDEKGDGVDVYMDPKAIELRRDTQADSNGHFIFQNMRSGNYFLQAWVYQNREVIKDVYDGQQLQAGGMIQYYHKETHPYQIKALAEGFVEIAHDGDKVSIDVTNHVVAPIPIFRAVDCSAVP
jgi:hypothetical protein